MMLDAIIEPLRAHPFASLVSFLLPLLVFYVANLLFFHPLSHIPGPLIRRITALPLYYTSFVGTEASSVAALHARYGPIVLVAPNEVDIEDGAAVQPIYVDKGGFRKHACYRNFDSEGHQTIFSTYDHLQRAPRAKAVFPLFATAKLRASSALTECADDFVRALRAAKERAASSGSDVDVLDLARRHALDSLCAYLFGRRYGAFEGYTGGHEKLSASHFVDSFVAFGRFFLLPGVVFHAVGTLYEKLFPPGEELEKSAAEVDAYVQRIVDDAYAIGGDTFQKRLLDAGISKHETIVQCKDLIFAGTDTSGMNTAMCIWNLVQHPDDLQALHEEIVHSTPPTTLPLLHATIREGLRTSMANPTRFPRIVPQTGWTYTPSILSTEATVTHGGSSAKSYHLPAGTSVGVSPYSLHYSKSTYASPRTFDPSRWTTAADTAEAALMNRDHFAFGAGSRQCIARNLAVEEMTLAIGRVVESGVLRGARVTDGEIPCFEWFNARIKGGKGVRIYWPSSGGCVGGSVGWYW